MGCCLLLGPIGVFLQDGWNCEVGRSYPPVLPGSLNEVSVRSSDCFRLLNLTTMINSKDSRASGSCVSPILAGRNQYMNKSFQFMHFSLVEIALGKQLWISFRIVVFDLL